MITVRFDDGSFCQIGGGFDENLKFDNTVGFSFCIESEDALRKIKKAIGNIVEAKAVLDSGDNAIFHNINFTITV
jgi:hypothetical protein